MSLRVLVVDDSAYNRRTIAELLETLPDVEVVGKAADGDEALRMAAQLTPDLVTLDLEMPRMDGFTFLRLLMARQPIPVIVVSGYSAKENVFRALELGALDFVAKPTRTVSADLAQIRAELADKVSMVKHLSPAAIDPRQRGSTLGGRTATQAFRTMSADGTATPSKPREEPRRVVVVGASTGGPTALLELFARFPMEASAALVVAQHMPEKFTQTFAQRLDRLGKLRVREAEAVETLSAGQGRICPGGRCLELARVDGSLATRVLAPSAEDRYVPSVDLLFESAAGILGDRVVAVVLTGMGDDGARGIRAVKEAGGTVLAESPETAVIYGMPGAAVRTGLVDRSMPLRQLAEELALLVRSS